MKRKLWTKLLSMLLVVATLLATMPVSVFAEQLGGASNEVYIKDVKLMQSGNKAEAKALLEESGYIFVDKNLNEGTGADGIWLGYTTTTDPTEAIYDIKLMNTKGGYTLTSMEAVLESQKSTFLQMARDMNDLIEEFRDAYNANSVAAQKAYMALNFFRVVKDETVLEEENGLGYQFVHGKMSLEDLTELILFCDGTIFDSIIKTLAMGIQLKTDNWMENLSALGPYDSEKTYSQNETELKRRAKQLLVVFRLYAQTYNAMNAVGLFKEAGTGNPDGTLATPEQKEVADFDIARAEMYKVIFQEFAKYPYGNGTLKDFIVSLENETNEKALYPLVSILSDGEFAAFSFGCFVEMAAGATAKASDFDKYDEEFANLTKDMSSFYLYEGVNSVLLDKDAVIAFTEEANRDMALTGEYQFYEKANFGEKFWEDGKYVALGIQCLGAVAMVGAKVTLGLMSLKGVLAAATAKNAVGILAGVAKVCTFIGSAPFQLIITAAALAVALVSYIVYCIYDSWRNSVHWSKNPIPEYIYDVKDVEFASTSENGGITTEYMQKTAFVFYEVVTDIQKKPVDLNARSSDASQWIAMYVSYDRPGDDCKPIKANDFKINYGNGETPAGYTPVSRFGEARAYDLNQWDDDDDVNGIFMYYKQDKTIAVKSDRTYYIKDVILQAGESPAHCISLLESAKFIPLNVNLSPDYDSTSIFFREKVCTYLGYKLTDNPTEAITDLRLEYGAGTPTKQYGAITYAASGTSAGVTLYTTKYAEAGTPILAGGLICVNDRDDAPEGYEPVNFFAGGPAVSFNLPPHGIEVDTTEYFLYFLPQTTFTDGVAYLGGLAYNYINDTAFTKLLGTSDKKIVFDYLKEKTGNEYPMTTAQEWKEAVSDYAFLKFGYHLATAEDRIISDSILYYTTYNPYRAIYNVKGTGVAAMPNSFAFEGVGYTAWNYAWFDTEVHSGTMGHALYYFYFRYNNQGVGSPMVMNGNYFVAGNPVKGNTFDETTQQMTNVQPLELSDMIILKKTDDASALLGENSAYNPVVDLFGTTNEPLAVKKSEGQNEYVVYIAKSEAKKPYISSITAVDTLTLFRELGGSAAGLNRKQITTGMLLAQLAGQGATHFVEFSPKLYNYLAFNGYVSNVNTLKFGYTRTADEDQALRDIFIYFGGFTTDAPPSEIYRGNVKYTMVCEIPYNHTGYKGAPRLAMYIYGTTDSRAGEPITDIEFSNTPFIDGYKAARTQNGRSVWSEMSEYLQDQLGYWATDYNSAYNLFVRLLARYNIYEIDTAPNAASFAYHYERYFYILTQQEGADLPAEKPYISELYLPIGSPKDAAPYTGKEARALESVFDQGADAIVNISLTQSRNISGNPVYLGYKRTADPKNAITEIRVKYGDYTAKTLNINGVVYNLVSDTSIDPKQKIYFFYTKSQNPDVGSPISDIIFVTNTTPSYYTTETAEVLPVMRWDKWQPSNLNEGTSRDSLYLLAVRPFERPMGSYVEIDYGKDKTTTRYNPSGKAEGAYIAALYVMDKNTIRQEKLAAGVPSADCTCDKITDQEVFDRLKSMGATTIINTPISVTGGDYKNNTNKVFIGYSRTDKATLAIKHILIQTELFATQEPAEMITVNNVNYDLVAEAAKKVTKLPRAINLLGVQDGQDLVIPKMYLYTSTEGKTEPIRDICFDRNPLKEGWVTVKSDTGAEPFATIYEKASKQAELGAKDSGGYDEEIIYSDKLYQWMENVASMFNPKDAKLSPFYFHCKMYDGNSIEETLPYIKEIYIAEGDSVNDALVKLVNFAPDGFVDYNMNKGTWFGKDVYIAYKRTANRSEAIRELAIFTGKNPSESKLLSINGANVIFNLTASVDLNSGAGGDWLYLYATTGTAAGEPIKSLRVSNDVVNRVSGGGFTEFTVKRANNNGFTDLDPDLNDGARGDYIYLVAKRDVVKSDWPSWMFGGALFGDGSLRTVFVLAGVAAVVAVLVYSRKKKASEE